jgi:hypothetical protein
MKKSIAIILGIIFICLVGLAAITFITRFAVRGRFLTRHFNNAPFSGRFYGNRGGMPIGRENWKKMGGGAGQITKIDGDTITIQKPNGQTYSLTLKDNTVINKTVKGSKDDLKTGESVMVFGNGMFGTQTILVGQQQ